MRRLFRWAALGSLLVSPLAVAAGEVDLSKSIRKLGRPLVQPRVAFNSQTPDPAASVTRPVGSGAVPSATSQLGESLTIPQYGSVDTGYSSVREYVPSGSTMALPEPASSSYSYAPAPIANHHHGGAVSGEACSSCGSTSCHGNCGAAYDMVPQYYDSGYAGGGWFGGLYYVKLFREDDGYGTPLAYAASDPANPVLTTGSSRMSGADGLGLRLGKMLNGCWAVEGIYWQVFPDDETRTATYSAYPSGISSNMSFDNLTYDAGAGVQPVDYYFQNTQRIDVTRTFDYRNFELNFLNMPWLQGGNPCAKSRLALLAGVRYFRAQESFDIYSDFLNEMPGDNPAYELRYFNEVENHLLGFQLGALYDRCFTNRLSGQIGSKFGIYNNHMEQNSYLGSSVGDATVASGPYTGQAYRINSEKDDIAFLGELDAGLSYCVSQRWRVTGGYKVLAVSGYADPLGQIPYSFANTREASWINNNNSLILHGAYAGVEFCW